VTTVDNPLSEEDILEYWGGLFGHQTTHNEEAKWLADKREEVKNMEETKWNTLTPPQKIPIHARN